MVALLLALATKPTHWIEVGKPIDNVEEVWCALPGKPLLTAHSGGHCNVRQLADGHEVPWGTYELDQLPIGVDAENNLVLIKKNAIAATRGGPEFPNLSTPYFMDMLVRGQFSLIRGPDLVEFRGQRVTFHHLWENDPRTAISLSATTGAVDTLEATRSGYVLTTISAKGKSNREDFPKSMLPKRAFVDPHMEPLGTNQLIIQFSSDEGNTIAALDKSTGKLEPIITVPEESNPESLLPSHAGEFAEIGNGRVGIVRKSQLHVFARRQ